MRDILQKQLAFVPKMEGQAIQAPIVVCGGMGGSAFPAEFAQFLGSSVYLVAHRDYGLPAHVPAGAHYIALSYSGNTAETVSFAQEALAKGLPLSVVTDGGELLEFAKAHNVPHVLVPAGLVPREAILYLVKGLLALLGEEKLFQAPENEASFEIDVAEELGRELAAGLAGVVPVFYSSQRNEVLSHFAKILFNETAKVPAFSNVFPELNHNEMQGYGLGTGAKGMTHPFIAVFLRDESDDERVKHRMDLTESLLKEHEVKTLSVALPSDTRTNTFLYTWWLMRTATRELAEKYGVDSDATPLIEDFKKKL